MGQQISVEDAFPTFQKRCTELFEANLLLQAQVDVLERQMAAAQEEKERQLADARQEIEQLRAQTPTGQAPQPLSCVDTDALP